MSISVSLDSALSALLAHQAGVDTTSHNIANVATTGYSRQRVRLQGIPGSYTLDPMPRAGMGVDIVDVERVRDIFVGFQIRIANQAAGRFAARAASLQRVEIALGEPSESGLRTAMSAFWNSWRDLSNAPDSGAARITVVQSAETMALTAQRIHGSLLTLRDEADLRLRADITEIHQLSAEIAALNEQISTLAISGHDAGDLRDRRDLALDRLSTLLDVHYTLREDGTIDVDAAGRSLVRSNSAFAVYGDPNIANNNYVDIKFVVDDAPLTIGDGELRGLIDQRNTELPALIEDLNTLVSQIIADVNAAHAGGYGLDGVTGRAFFAGTDASDIAVDAIILGDLDTLAAATNFDVIDGTPPGDGSNAAAISDLQYALALSGATVTYDEFYGAYVGSIGAAVQQSERVADAQGLLLLADAQGLLLQQLEAVRQSESGVNLDEEMVQLMRYQRAYEAAARVISVVDEMLDTLINRTI